MAIDARTRQILWGQAGGTCSFPRCGRPLVKEATSDDREVIVGEIAHIVAQNKGGPRAQGSVPGGNLDGYENLILLCHEHHELIDQQIHTYSVEKLLQFKSDHEQWVRARLSKQQEIEGLSLPNAEVTEHVYANVLPVTQLPHYVYTGSCTVPEDEIKALIRWPEDGRIITPYFVQGGKLFAFNDLKDFSSPFASIVDPLSAERHSFPDWFQNPDQMRLYVQLLNRTLNKVTGRLGLKLDKEHKRYFFEPDEPGKDKRIAYQTIGGVRSERSVSWNPRFRHNDMLKPYWEHLAVGLRFHRLGNIVWGLAIRPERRFTKNGFEPLDGKFTGRKSTKRKSRMYNFDLLQEVQFWRDFICQGKPRLTCLFGKQALVIDNSLLAADIRWPEVCGDEANRMAACYEDDLFSLAELDEVKTFDEFDSELGELDTEEEVAVEDED